MTGRMNGRTLLGLALTISALQTGCANGSEKLTQLPAAEKSDKEPESFPVAVALVTRQAIVRSVVANGTTEPARVAALGPQMSGRISALYVHEGDKVKANANLVRLDADEASLRIQQTAASAAQAKSQYELARAEYERLAPLLQRGTITPQQLQRLEAQRDALKSATEAAALANSDAQRVHGNTLIRAPFAGIVSKVPVEVGEIATMMPPTVLLRLVDLSSVDVRVRVHERELSRVAIGDQIEAKFPSSNQKALGQVTFISPEIDPRTRNAEVVTRIPNTDGSLRAGMFAEITIKPKTSPNSLVIPSAAVAGTGDDRYVFVIHEGIAKRQKVKVAPVDSQLVEVLEGVQESQLIVGEGLGRLSDGAHVTPKAEAGKP
ncbi:MAG: efflux transporter, family, subunit [Myxococcaceae bacterium]|nr:efflux transporter, family, subunit [Myxococcaceae bacterium]